jgi:hypothetical protein
LFAEIKENLILKWECAVEWYLLRVDNANTGMNSKLRAFQSRFVQVTEHPEHPRRLVQLTLLGIILTFTVILFSCQTPPRPVMQVQPRKFDASRPERELDQLYLKRNEVIIKNSESGSSTGSIWADSREPRALLADASPSREGQTVTILIPEELRFDPKNTSADKAGSKDKKTASSPDKETGKDGLKLTDPDEASPSQTTALRPVKSMKMQIVGFEPTGDVYLRGIRKYTGANGEENSIMVLAKVPRRQLTSFQLDARELTDIAVNEDLGGRMREYSAQGWDEMVSRRLSGFSPDLKSELASLDSLRDEIKTVQASLRDQAKANELERDRIRKERSRMSGQSANASGAQAPSAPAPEANPADARQAPAAAAPATAEPKKEGNK